MQNTTYRGIILSVSVFAIFIILFMAKSTANTPSNNAQLPIIYISTPEPTIIPTPIETPIPTPTTSTPSYIPTLRTYEIDKSNDIWHAKAPSSYITPDNEYVRYYAFEYQKYLDGEESDYPQINYVADDGDYWQNAEYTLFTGQGDCEDAAIAWASIHRALGHEVVVVGGELWFNDGSPNIRDFWYEWIDDDGVKNIKFVAPITQTKEFTAIPKYMFNDKITWRSYDEKWY